MYHRCGANLSQQITEGNFKFTTSHCEAVGNNYFVILLGWIYFLGRDGVYSLIGFNIFLVLAACNLMVSTIDRNREKVNYHWLLFFPPIFYIAIRPAKEATVAFLISLTCFSMNQKTLPQKGLWLSVSLIGAYFIRWQLALGILVALGFYIIWIFLSKLSNAAKLKFIFGTIVVILSTWLIYKTRIINFLNINFIHSRNVEDFANKLDGAVIYKFMTYGNGENSLDLWNVFIAHLGGLVTPHPFRFIKEYLRDQVFYFHIFEESIFVSTWFFMLFPIFILFLKENFFERWRRISSIPRIELFKFVFIFLLFSMACFSILFQAPQLFRYKVPLNIYLYSTICFFILEKSSSDWLFLAKQYKVLLVLYVLGFAAYSLLYLSRI